MDLLKTIGKGFLYIIALPFFLIVLAVVAVFGLFMLVFLFFKSIVLFFTGRSLNDDLPEDIKVKEIKSGKNTNAQQPQPEPEEEPLVQPYVAPAKEQTPIENAVFGQQASSPVQEPEPEPVFEEEPVEETNDDIFDNFLEKPIDESQIPQEEPKPIVEEEPTQIDTANDEPEKDLEEIQIGQYVPHTDSSRFMEDTSNSTLDDDDDDSGVDIIYGDNND